MTYLALAAPFVAASAILFVVALVLRPPRRPAKWWAAWVTALVMLFVLTAVFDNVMIAIGLMHYAPERISGLRIGAAPLEDFAYPLAALLLLPALWMLFAGRRRS
jgi:lycopene cyclase domain-containing protein